ncbi:response regulator transcription factor [Paenibacillus agricola]|uniref:Response regulator n=1 Tax=Paenibacillus agricola TaxID=2716264 RepID=A0ABX0IY46_9BACL|nr:response regulator [Paenibacillus agricola]NHN28882.1 response regulator [Paenibacillus agricola]
MGEYGGSKGVAKNLLRIIIVDDELPIRQRLQMFDWLACGAEVVGEAENGEEALDLCASLLPDIVFTDIKMPVMTGLDLLKQISQEYPEIPVVLITSFDDFNYVHQALKMGAVDYLMKVTLRQEELAQTIDKARAWIQNRFSQKEYERGELRKHKSQMFRQMLGHSQPQPQEQSQELLKELLQPERLPELPFRFIRLITRVKREDEMVVDQQLQEVLNVLQKKNKPAGPCYWFWFSINLGDYLVWFPHAQTLDELTAAANHMLSHIRASLATSMPYLFHEAAVYAIISSEVHSYSEYREVFRETFYWVDYCFFNEDYSVFMGKPVPMQVMDGKLEFELRTGFRRSLTDISSFNEYIRNDFNAWMLKHRVHPAGIRMFLKSELQEWNSGSKDIAQDHNQLATRIDQSATMDELISNMIYWMEDKRGDFVRTEIRRAKEMIQQRLGEPVTLSAIAEEVGLSGDYFGRLFHEELGMTFKEYLTRCRIEKAIELLQTTNLKVYTVSEMVGFPSYRYFAPLFRKFTGLSPSDYKRG